MNNILCYDLLVLKKKLQNIQCKAHFIHIEMEFFTLLHFNFITTFRRKKFKILKFKVFTVISLHANQEINEMIMFLQLKFPFAAVFLPHLGLHIFLLSFLIYSTMKFKFEVSIYKTFSLLINFRKSRFFSPKNLDKFYIVCKLLNP